MRIGFQLRMMLIAISKERWRMLLAVAAVALSLASVMILLALSAGANHEMRAILVQVGINVLTVSPERVQAVTNRGGQWYMSERLTIKDRDSIAAAGVFRAVVPEAEESLLIQYNGEDLRTTVKGTSIEFPAVRNYEIASGRFFAPADDALANPVAVLGSFVVDKLNGGFSMLDETVWIRGIAFTVIGQFREKGLSDSGTNYDDLIAVPYNTALTRLYQRDYLDQILLQADSAAGIDGRVEVVRDILRSNHRIGDGAKDDFRILQPLSSDRAKRTTDELLGGLAFFFTVITLAIGGAGVFSVSYLNVLDRRGEIGLRMALGATRRSIVGLFVLEAVLLSAIGCAGGLLLGTAAIGLLALWTEWRLAFDLPVLAVPALLSAALGVVFGALPAYKAASMLPVDALRAA